MFHLLKKYDKSWAIAEDWGKKLGRIEGPVHLSTESV